MLLGTFPKDFSQAATSQGHFPKGQLPNCAISQAVIYPVCPSRSARPPPLLSVLAAALGHIAVSEGLT